MIATVLDVIVIVSGFTSNQGAPADLIERWLSREFQLILSEHILDGVARAWNKAWFQERYDANEAQRALGLLRTRATIVVPVSVVHGVAPDWEDDLVLTTAVAGNATYLVTGDRRFRAVGRHGTITFCSPREFALILGRLPRSLA